MKAYSYKIGIILLFFGVALQAQTYDKKIEDRFKVNSDVEIVVNTAHMDVEIETWNKNEVSVEAVMEVEGVDKKEANKILKDWKFEALGNKNKVKITSMSGGMNFEFTQDFDFDFPEIDINVPHIEIHEFDVEFPEIELPEMPEIPEMPEMPDMGGFEFDYELYKNDTTYLNKYKEKVIKSVEKFNNSEWKKKLDSFRNSKEFKIKIEEYKKANAKLKHKIHEMKNSEEFKKSMEDAKKAIKDATKQTQDQRVLIVEQVELAKDASKAARDEVKRLKEEGKLDSLYSIHDNIIIDYRTENNSKFKIKKYLKIKVPKKATFNLNVRHGKVTIPESNKKMSANMSYGYFVGGAIIGAKNELVFSNSPVTIETLNSSNITLKNVPNAKFGTFNSVNLFSNSSDVIIEEIGNNVALSQKFGNLKVEQLHSNFEKLNIIIDYAKAIIDTSNASFVYQINGKKSTFKLNKNYKQLNNKNIDGVQIIEGFNKDKTSGNKLFLTGVFSTINLN